MNINFNNIYTNTAIDTQAIQTSSNVESAKEKATNLDSFELTISQAKATIEDIKAAGLPEDALKRDDDLGKLVSYAFSLPPPPFPEV